MFDLIPTASAAITLPTTFVVDATAGIETAIGAHMELLLALLPIILVIVFGKKILGWVSGLLKFGKKRV